MINYNPDRPIPYIGVFHIFDTLCVVANYNCVFKYPTTLCNGSSDPFFTIISAIAVPLAPTWPPWPARLVHLLLPFLGCAPAGSEQ